MAVAVGLWRCFIPLVRIFSDDTIARRVDRYFPVLHDRVTMTLQLWRQREARVLYHSPALLDAAIVASAESTRSVDFTEADARWRLQQAGWFFGGAVLVSTIVLGLFFTSLSPAFERLAHPLTGFPVPQRTFIAITPGDVEVSVGSYVTVTAVITGEMPDEATIRLFSDDNQQIRTASLLQTSGSTFSYTFRDVKQSVGYDIETGDAVSARFRISVVDRPSIASLHLTYRYPEYTRLVPRTTAVGTGDIVALKGTRVTITVEASQTLASASLALSGTQREISMAVNHHEANATIQVQQDQRYKILLRNQSGRINSDPAQYQITALPDRMPDIRIISPGRDTDLTENMMVPLMISAGDDFGFSSMNLVYRVGSDEDQRRKFIPIDRDATTLSLPYVWDLSDMGLFPEDVVSYFVEVFDNDTISGPKRAVSQTFTVRFPSIVEIYEQLELNQKTQVADFEEMMKEQDEAKEQLRDLNRELTKTATPEQKKELSWEQKKQIESLVAKQEKMAENVLKAAEAMEQAIQQLEQHDMMNQDLIEKMNQLRQLFQEITTPELMKALQEIKKAMKDLDQQQLKESMKDFELAQEEFMKRLERSLSILKRMRAEQEMASVLKKIQELVKRQKELQYATQNASQNPTQQTRESLADKQSELKRDTESVRQELEDLARSMEDLQSNLPSEEVHDIAQSMDRQEVLQQMSRISQQLSEGQMNPAARSQQQVAENLSRMSQQLQSVQEQMQADQKQEIAAEMRQTMHDLVDLSQEQETLRSRTTQPTGRDSRFQNLEEDQRGLIKGTSQVADQLVATAQKSFFISPQVGQSLGESLNRMQGANQKLSERNRGTASQQQTEAMQALNRTVLALRQAMNDMNASSSASGLMEMLQKLQSMAQEQSGLNDELTRMMQQQGEGQAGKQMSMEERARVARLAQEQEKIRKSLEQLQREQRQQSDVLGQLSEIEREMKETIKELLQQQIDPRLIERQQRILSRLLDASRSMRERDFNNKRKALSGQDLTTRPLPGELPSSLLEYTQPLRDDLLRSVRDGTYPREYEELIRAYFRALSEEPREQK